MSAYIMLLKLMQCWPSQTFFLCLIGFFIIAIVVPRRRLVRGGKTTKFSALYQFMFSVLNFSSIMH